MLEKMPSSVETEASLLGILLDKPEHAHEAMETLKPQDWYTTSHRLIFEALMSLTKASQEIDIVSVAEYLKTHEQLEAVGGRTYINQLAIDAGLSGSVTHYIDVILDKAKRRQAIKAAYNLIETAQDETKSDFLQEACSSILTISEDTGIHKQADFSEHLVSGLDELFAPFDEEKPDPTVKTGFRELDDITNGLHPGHFVIVAARPAMGKTAFSLNIAHSVTMANKRVLFFSLEMSGTELAKRLILKEAGSTKHLDRMSHAITTLDGLPLTILDNPQMTISSLRLAAKRETLKNGPLGLIVLDYLQLLESENRTENRVQEISTISRQLKLLARELNVPVMALSQLNRGVESRQDKRPLLSDLRDSGALEQDADQVWMLYRDEYYNKDSQHRGIVEVIISKNRHGGTGTASLLFQPALCQFRDKLCVL